MLSPHSAGMFFLPVCCLGAAAPDSDAVRILAQSCAPRPLPPLAHPCSAWVPPPIGCPAHGALEAGVGLLSEERRTASGSGLRSLPGLLGRPTVVRADPHGAPGAPPTCWLLARTMRVVPEHK